MDCTTWLCKTEKANRLFSPSNAHEISGHPSNSNTKPKLNQELDKSRDAGSAQCFQIKMKLSQNRQK